MSGEPVERLFDEVAAAYARGERPDVAAALTRAGDGADELAALLDAFLASSPARPTTAADRALMHPRLAEEPPLLALRLERRLTRDAVVEKLMGLLGLDPGKRAKVRGYFADLEVGVLDPRGVKQAVWDALGQVLGEDAATRALHGGKGVSFSVATAYYRVANRPELAEAAAPLPAPAAAEPEEPDEVDRLFTADD